MQLDFSSPISLINYISAALVCSLLFETEAVSNYQSAGNLGINEKSFFCPQYNGTSYSVVSSCAPGYNDYDVVKNCLLGMRGISPQWGVPLTLPVTNPQSNLTYANIFCAFCNNDYDYVPWEVKLDCRQYPYNAGWPQWNQWETSGVPSTSWVCTPVQSLPVYLESHVQKCAVASAYAPAVSVKMETPSNYCAVTCQNSNSSFCRNCIVPPILY